jgi:hypothetical protein
MRRSLVVNPVRINRRLALVSQREAPMNELQLTLTAEERKYLVDLLEVTLKETQVEEHRTRTPSYRQHVLQQEGLIVQLLNKLRPSAR